MIKRIKNSLTIKICTLIAVLLAVSSGITYAVIVGFLPTYYSKQLQKDIDSVSQEMIETIHSYETINEASYAIELFEAGSKVSVVILDEQGNSFLKFQYGSLPAKSSLCVKSDVRVAIFYTMRAQSR